MDKIEITIEELLDKAINGEKLTEQEWKKVVNYAEDKELDEIDGNREALNKLTIEQLKRLDKYYDAIIEENKSKIKKAQM